MPGGAPTYSLEQILPALVGVMGGQYGQAGAMGGMFPQAGRPIFAAGGQGGGGGGAIPGAPQGGGGGAMPPPGQAIPIGPEFAEQYRYNKGAHLAAGIGTLIGNVLIANHNLDNPLGLPWWLGGRAQGMGGGDSGSRTTPGQPGPMMQQRGSPTANNLAAPMASGGGGGGGMGGLGQVAGALGSLYSSGMLGGAGAAGAAGAGAAGAAGAGAGAAGAGAAAGLGAAAGAGAAAAGAGAAGAAAAGGAAAGGAAAGGGASALVGLLVGLLCWVAEELFGEADPRTWLARLWCAAHPRHPFVRVYRRYGRTWAAWLRLHPWAKPIVRPVWQLMARQGAAYMGRHRAAIDGVASAR